MAGWLLVWSRDDSQPDPARWDRSTRAAKRYGEAVSEHRQERVFLAAWRRESGEFPASGKISSLAGAQLAWLGQVVEDSGDATGQAMSVVAADRFDPVAAARLNGPFAAAVVRGPFEVRIVTDRHRHYPVYLHCGRHVSVASTEIRCVVPWLDRPELDRDAIDMLLRCGELIDRQTLLAGVEMLPPGCVLSDAGQGASEQRYWSMRSDAAGAPVSTTAEKLGEALKVGVRRLEAVTPRLGITLSGGLDSRIILDLCNRPQRVPSFTWGLPHCRDIICASEFASLIQSPHVVKHWEPEAFPPLWSRGVDLTGGNCGIDTMFMLPFVPLLASACDVVFNGLAGDVVLGGNWLKNPWIKEDDAERLGRAVWRWRVPHAHDHLVDRLTARAPGMSSASERWIASIAAREGARPIERLNDWLIENRIFRTTNCGTMLLRGGVESHSPFFDRDFVDALTRVDQEHKLKHKLYLDVINRVAPRAASVTWQRTNLRPSQGYYANLAAMAFQSLVTKACSPMGYKPFRNLQVADLAGWLRGPWRQPVESMIVGDRFLERRLVDPDVVREVWQAHLGGADHSRQISVLVTTELFSRMTIDGDLA